MRKGKVCMVVNNKIKFDSRVLREASSLSKVGFEVVVYCLKGQEPTDFKIFKVKELDIKNFSPVRINGFKFFSQFSPALREITKEKAQIYHAHDLDTLIITWLAANKNHAELVYDAHEYWPGKTFIFYNIIHRSLHFIKKLEYYMTEKFLIKRADLVITVNDSIADLLSKYYKIPRPLVIYNYPMVKSKIKLRNDYLRKRLNLSDKDKIALYLGGINKYRGLENLIKCIHFLPTNIKIVIVGYGYLKQRLINMINELSLKKRIYILDAVKPKEIMDLASSADLGVSPIQNASVSYYYSSPNKVFEYLASALPIAVSNFPEMEKIVEENKVGLTFDPEDPKDIARTVKEILSDETRYKQMRENAFKVAREKYNWELEEKKLINLYRGLLN